MFCLSFSKVDDIIRQAFFLNINEFYYLHWIIKKPMYQMFDECSEEIKETTLKIWLEPNFVLLDALNTSVESYTLPRT